LSHEVEAATAPSVEVEDRVEALRMELVARDQEVRELREAEEALQRRAAEEAQALAERDREVRELRMAEEALRRRATEEAQAMRAEVSETRLQQEALLHKLLEAEEVLLEQRQLQQEEQRERQTAAAGGAPRPLLELLGVPPDAPKDAKRARLHEAACELRDLVRELSDGEASQHDRAVVREGSEVAEVEVAKVYAGTYLDEDGHDLDGLAEPLLPLDEAAAEETLSWCIGKEPYFCPRHLFQRMPSIKEEIPFIQ